MSTPRLKAQPNTWTCGPAALHNAIGSLGGRAPAIKRLIELTKANPEEGCEYDRGRGMARTAGITKGRKRSSMLRGARAVGYDLVEDWTLIAPIARARILEELGKGRRILMLCDRDYEGPLGHWLSVHRASARYVWIADSSGPGPVESRLTWKAFLARACTVLGPAEWTYALYVLVPQIEDEQ